MIRALILVYFINIVHFLRSLERRVFMSLLVMLVYMLQVVNYESLRPHFERAVLIYLIAVLCSVERNILVLTAASDVLLKLETPAHCVIRSFSSILVLLHVRICVNS